MHFAIPKMIQSRVLFLESVTANKMLKDVGVMLAKLDFGTSGKTIHLDVFLVPVTNLERLEIWDVTSLLESVSANGMSLEGIAISVHPSFTALELRKKDVNLVTVTMVDPMITIVTSLLASANVVLMSWVKSVTNLPMDTFLHSSIT